MNKAEFKIGNINGNTVHYSVGAIIENDGKYLLLDRKNPPYGFAGLAGHIDEGEEPEQAISREVKEESGLTIVNSELLFAEFVPWNECSKGTKGHYWYVFVCTTQGDIQVDDHEAKSLHWYTVDELKELTLEPVWGYWFKKLNLV